MELYGSAINATAKTSAVINKTFTAGGSYTIPVGYSKADIFCVGGGSGNMPSYGGNYGNDGCGGGGGYTKTVIGTAISSGQVLQVVIGSGGSGVAGGVSSVTRSGASLCSAAGGTNTHNGSYANAGMNGGSGGGAAMMGSGYNGGAGGTNGGNGGATNYSGGKGQGSTTRAWGSSTGTLYAGGGGGGGGGSGSSYTAGGAGGAGGGGAGGRGGYRVYAGDDEYSYYNGANGVAGTANTGGGGGGGGYNPYEDTNRGRYHGYSAKGGSGIVLIKLY